MRNLLLRYGNVLRAPEGAGGGAPGGEGAGAGAGAGEGDAPGGAGEFSYPDGFPDEYKGGSLEESFSKLFGGFSDVSKRADGLRTQLAQMPKAPESPGAYSYEPSDKLKPYFGNLAEDKVFGQAREAFHKHNVPQEAFQGIIEDLYGPLVDQGVIAAPYSAEGEVKTFMNEMGLDRQSASSALTNVDAFAKGIFGQLKGIPENMKEAAQAEMMALTDTAAGNVLLHSLMQRLSESGIRVAGETTLQGEISEAELKKLDADPRIDPNNRNHPDPDKRFDEDLRRRYDEAYKKLAPKNNTAW